MLIEHKIKLEANGLTITQRIESSGFQTPPLKNQAGVIQRQLGSSHAASQAASAITPPSAATQHSGGGGFGDVRDPGGGGPDGFGSGPVTVIGPIILTCPPCKATGEEP